MSPSSSRPTESLPASAVVPAVPDADSPQLRGGGAEFAAIRSLLADGAPKLVVLDDDPTGTQTVHGIDVLTEWSVPSLAAALADSRPAFFVLTNSRSLPEPAAAALNAEIAANLHAAAGETGTRFSIVSRSDSTLRGHFRAEVDALIGAQRKPVDGVIVAPAFFEGGRYTIGNVHYVADRGALVPAAATEFAHDATFGYRESDLTRWIEEKTAGGVRATDVVTISIEQLRKGGPDSVNATLGQLSSARFVVVNAEGYRDLETFVSGLLRAERAGKHFLFRTAASFVRVRAGVAPRAPLPAEEIAGGGGGGLIVVGSYVGKTTEQLRLALGAPGVAPIEVDVDRFIEPESRRAEVARAAAAANATLAAGRHALVYTSRKQVSALGRAGDLDVARTVSSSLVEIVRGISVRPAFFIAKGGITSSDLAVHGVGVRRARILGQAAAGIPVWRLGDETTWPGVAYVVFPGNVGSPESLAALIASLGGSQGGTAQLHS